ncbi:hypothetical protein [Candidatus Contubernalis alkaliaceticus]|uniref:hypothetical protein n=1 Tax=Candidatus Contubernalis alkaliaceticus TaxID=338645 RepID=UPI001F4C4C4A|nr:hypothetical protein [Candidatus Contubernalis alkalaceticus]UNC91708.1 hypothetical protein HUE98_06135 [Candidatus Contubernalis alkalaceticus]
MMNTVLIFAQQWWGLLLLTMVLVGYLFYDYEAAKKKIAVLIFVAEEQAREKCLRSGQEKFEWVVKNGYNYLPIWLKLIISEEAFKVLVQSIFDNMVKWAENQRLRDSFKNPYA